MWREDAVPPDSRREVEGAGTITCIAGDLYAGLFAGTRSAEEPCDGYPGS